MIEFGVDAHVSLDSLPGSKKAVGSKPVVLFLGDQWESDTMYTRIQNLLLDFFRGDKIDMISLKGVDHVIACTAVDGKILLRTYAVGFRKSGTKVCCCNVIDLNCGQTIQRILQQMTSRLHHINPKNS